MNLLPVPRHVDLVDRTVAASEPRVALGVSGIPAQGYTLRIADRANRAKLLRCVN